MRDAERIRYLILAAQREGNRQLGAALRPLGLTPAQGEVLRLLAERGPLTLTGLGELLVCESGTNPSRLVDRLVAAGLVSRLPGTDDRRLVSLKLTAQGRSRESRVREIENALYGAIDAALTGVEVAGTIDLLTRLVEGTSAGRALSRRD